jgi:inner membrane protein
MPTIITHAAVAAGLTGAFPSRIVPRRVVALGVICSIAPDVDVLGSRLGIRYGDLWGHRGLTHSLVFALAFSLLAWVAGIPTVAGTIRRLLLWLYLFVSTASHGLLDAFTNGGLGVAFFSPFDTTRYFFPFRPIAVSPIGVRFFSERGVYVLWSEFVWVCIPLLIFATAAFVIRRAFSRQAEV